MQRRGCRCKDGVCALLQALLLALPLASLDAQLLPVANDYRSLSTAMRPIIPDIMNDIKLTGAAYRRAGRLPTNSIAPKILLEDLLMAIKMSDASYEGEVFPTYNTSAWTSRLAQLNVASDVAAFELVNVNVPAPPGYNPLSRDHCTGLIPTNTFAYAALMKSDPGQATFIFRGTNPHDPANVITDICYTAEQLDTSFSMMCPSAADGTLCMVGKGFQQAFQSVKQQLLASWRRISSNNQTPTKVLCTGHSLGGALATLCGLWAKAQWPFATVRVITAGCPRLGNAPFTQHFESMVDESWRIIHAADIIPMLPLPPVPDFQQVKTPVWLKRGSGDQNQTYTALLTARSPLGVYTSVDDHWVAGYIKALEYCVAHSPDS